MRAAMSSTRIEHHRAAFGAAQQLGDRRRVFDQRAAAARGCRAAPRWPPPVMISGARAARITSCPGTASACAIDVAEGAAADGRARRDRAAARVRAAARLCRRRGADAPCSARRRASGRPAPAPRGRCASKASRSNGDAEPAGDRGEMDERVGRAADRLQHDPARCATAAGVRRSRRRAACRGQPHRGARR